MNHFDVFNGDADGICALHQLRLADPRDATLVTGVKRDIALLPRVLGAACTSVTVLDVSLDPNRQALVELLQRGVTVQYFDHHFAGDIPQHAGLHAVIDTGAEVCTSILVDRHLGGAQRAWAVVGAFGDNLGAAARRLAGSMAPLPGQIEALRELGECLNYNAYGDHEADLIVHPATLYGRVHRHADPFRLIDEEPLISKIRAGRAQDLERARLVRPRVDLACGKVFVLPDAAWSRRVRGTLGNDLATAEPEMAHAVLTHDDRGGYLVSVRAPMTDLRDADRLCRQFPSGGGRAGAAGINHLPLDRLPVFLSAFEQTFGRCEMR